MATVKIAGKEYPIKFTVNVLVAIQKRYGDVTKWSDHMGDIGETLWILRTLINEGIAYDNYFRGQNTPEFTDERAFGMLVSIDDLNSPAIVDAIVEAYNESVAGEKKITAEELMSLASNMQAPTANQ